MKISKLTIIAFMVMCGNGLTQNGPFDKLDFLLGKWSGTGTGFGNETSRIESEFKIIMKGKYIEVMNDSKFKPTEKKPEGEHHVDKGMISFDKNREVIVYRQFNNEGYVNQYLLNDSLTSDSVLVFESEKIENFVNGGRARWTIKRLAVNRIETIFEVSFPGKEYTCFGQNILTRKK